MPSLPPYPAAGESDVAPPERDTLILEDDTLKHGFIQLPKIVLRARNLSRDAKLLYSILLSYAWDDDRCFPGYARLCDDMQASENMVRKYMRELMEIGLLSQKRRGLGKTNLYFMHAIRTSKIAVQDAAKNADQHPKKSAEYVESEIQESNTKSTYLRKEASLGDERRGRGGQPHQTVSDREPNASSPRFDLDPDDDASPAEVGEQGSGNQPLAAILATRAPRRDATHDDRVAIAATIEKFAHELGDATPKSSVTRAINLFQHANLSRDRFLDLLYQARATTRQKRGRMGYFFGVLDKWLAQQAVT